MNSNSLKKNVDGNSQAYRLSNSLASALSIDTQQAKRRTETYTPRIGHLNIDLERDTIDDTMAGVHGSFVYFLQKNTRMIAKAYRLEYAKSDELKYALVLTAYNKEYMLNLISFIDEFNHSKHSKYIKLSIEIVSNTWEGPAFTREIYW